MEKKEQIIKFRSLLAAALDDNLYNRAGSQQKDQFSKTVSELRKLGAQNLSEEGKLKEGKSMYMKLKQDRTFDSLPTKFCNDFADCFDDKSTQGPQKGDGISSSQRHDQVAHDDNLSVEAGPACQRSAHSPSQSRKQTPQSGEQENQDRQKLQERVFERSAHSPSQSRKQTPQSGEQENQDRQKLLERVKHLEQALDEKCKGTTTLQALFDDRLLQITEKDNELKRVEQETEYLAKSLEEEHRKYSNAAKDVTYKLEQMGNMEKQLNQYSSDEYVYKECIKSLKETAKHCDRENRNLEKHMLRERENMKEEMANVHRKHADEMKTLVVERNDLRDRFSKVAGAKLQDQNADIADLSDPNRAMKLSVRFGQIYDDEWTNAFESLTGKKINMPLKETIALLLHILQDCSAFCDRLVESQMDSLKSVILHPVQDMSKYAAQPRTNIGMMDRSRITSKDEQELRVLRRRIGVSDHVVEAIKHVFLLEAKCWGKEHKGYEKKLLEAYTPYLQKCAEICWMMALHDPPLYMKMDSKPGEKFDLNIFTVYSTTGDKLDYIVWPPLYNGRDGGLLSKGSAEPVRTIVKKK